MFKPLKMFKMPALKKLKIGNRGVSLYFAMMIMAIMMVIAFGLSEILIDQIKSVRNVGYSVTAYYAAETGIEEALYDSSCTSTCIIHGSLSSGASYTVSGLAGGASLCPAGATYCLVSTSTYEQTSRGIMVER